VAWSAGKSANGASKSKRQVCCTRCCAAAPGTYTHLDGSCRPIAPSSSDTPSHQELVRGSTQTTHRFLPPLCRVHAGLLPSHGPVQRSTHHHQAPTSSRRDCGHVLPLVNEHPGPQSSRQSRPGTTTTTTTTTITIMVVGHTIAVTTGVCGGHTCPNLPVGGGGGTTRGKHNVHEVVHLCNMVAGVTMGESVASQGFSPAHATHSVGVLCICAFVCT